MDDLERELRDVLTNDRRSLPVSLVPLERVHARAARRRRRRAAAMAGAAGVVVLAVAGTAVGLAQRGDRPDVPLSSTSPTQGGGTGTATGPAPTPSQATPAWDGARVVSMTATSTSDYVVLGQRSGSCGTDCLRIARTDDGGSTFSVLTAPRGAGAVDPAQGPGAGSVTDVRFADARDGWLFGGQLWSTHDSGATWTKLRLPGLVNDLEAAAGVAWALVTDPGGSDTAHLWRSPVGSDDWTEVPDVSVTEPAGLALHGGRVVVLGAQDSRLWVGGSGGFAEQPSPCPGAVAARLSATTSYWATCVTGMAATLATSPDGTTWRVVTPAGSETALPNSIVVGARTDTEAVVALGPGPVQRLTADGALTPVVTAPTGAVTYLGFTTAEVGYAVAGGELWRTDDGGERWRRVTPD